MDISLPVIDRRTWLFRLIYVRMIVFSVLLTAQPFLVKAVTANNTQPLFNLLLLVYSLSACWFLLWQLNRRYVGQAYAQILTDLLLITWTVNRTGGADSYFSSLYFLEIVMSSILLDRRGAFMTVSLSSV